MGIGKRDGGAERDREYCLSTLFFLFFFGGGGGRGRKGGHKVNVYKLSCIMYYLLSYLVGVNEGGRFGMTGYMLYPSF